MIFSSLPVTADAIPIKPGSPPAQIVSPLELMLPGLNGGLTITVISTPELVQPSALATVKIPLWVPANNLRSTEIGLALRARLEISDRVLSSQSML